MLPKNVKFYEVITSLMLKTLQNAIMKRSKLKNKANKSKLLIDIANFKKQRNYVSKLNKKCKVDYFNNVMDTSNTSKPFWNTCKPYFSNKHAKGDSKIILNETDNIILENKCIANIFNSYFESVTDSLELFEWPMPLWQGNLNMIDSIIQKFSFHPSIL